MSECPGEVKVTEGPRGLTTGVEGQRQLRVDDEWVADRLGQVRVVSESEELEEIGYHPPGRAGEEGEDERARMRSGKHEMQVERREESTHPKRCWPDRLRCVKSVGDRLKIHVGTRPIRS